MEIELVYFEDCPNWQLADARLREALCAVGMATISVTYRAFGSMEESERAFYRGSPTILLDGQDPFARADDPGGLACRLYPTAADSGHAPTVEQIRLALVNAA